MLEFKEALTYPPSTVTYLCETLSLTILYIELEYRIRCT